MAKDRQRLYELGARITSLRTQLTLAEAEFDRLMKREAGVQTEPEVEVPEGLQQRVLALMKESSPIEWTAEELTTDLKVQNVNTIRAVLSRLTADGSVQRVSRGRYAVPAPAPPTTEDDDIPF